MVDPTTRVRRTAAWTLVEDRVVVRARDLAVALDPVSSVVWRCLDGESPVGDVVADVADAFGVPASEALASILPVLGSWLDVGMVGDDADGQDSRARRALVPPPDG